LCSYPGTFPGSPHPSAARALIDKPRQIFVVVIAALGCGDPRGDLPLIHLMASSGTAILTAGVKNSPPFYTANHENL